MIEENQGLSGRVPSEPGSREPSPDGLGPSGFDPSRWAGRTHDGVLIPNGRTLLRRGRWSVLLLPRGTRASYSYPGYKPPIRFGFFRRSSYNTTLGVFLPTLPRFGAWRLIITRHAAWLRDSDGSPKGGDAEGGSVACDDSAGRKASPEARS